MPNEEVALYEAPTLYDAVVSPGPCERFYRDLAKRTGGPVLELACGTGRLSIPLAQDDHEVVGLDLSAAMLGAASRKAEAAGASIEFVEGDIRSFELGREFALIVLSCNSLSHLTTNEELIEGLRRLARHLAEGGLLAFDVVNPCVADLAGMVRAKSGAAPSEHRSNLGAAEELLAYDPVSQVRVMRWQLTGQGDQSRRTKPMQLRTIFPQELPLLLAAAGLELIARFGDFDGNPLAADSLNQVSVARRAREPAGNDNRGGGDVQARTRDRLFECEMPG